MITIKLLEELFLIHSMENYYFKVAITSFLNRRGSDAELHVFGIADRFFSSRALCRKA
jgi:hypothetical protein